MPDGPFAAVRLSSPSRVFGPFSQLGEAVAFAARQDRPADYVAIPLEEPPSDLVSSVWIVEPRPDEELRHQGDEPPQEPHPCPYRVELFDDASLCTCGPERQALCRAEV